MQNVGFPSLKSLNFYARHNKKLPGPCFETECITLERVYYKSSCEQMQNTNVPFKPYNYVTIWFHALFTPLSGYFSDFSHDTIHYRS